MAHWDAIVVGVGGVGSAALYHLACKGLRTLGIDRFAPPHDRGSSHGQTRIIRKAYFEHPDYVPLTGDSYRLWADLETATESHLLHQTGLIEVGPPDGIVVPGVLSAAREHDLEITEMSAREIRRRWPGLFVPDDLAGVFEPQAGYLRVEACVEAHLRAALDRHAIVEFDSPVTDWSVTKKHVSVRTRSGLHTTDRLIVTAGSWAGQVLKNLNINLTIRRKPLLWYAARNDSTYSADSDFPAFLFELPYGIFYGFPQLDARGVKVAEHSGGIEMADPLQLERNVLPVEREPVERFITDHLPQVTHNLTDSTVCMYTMSPDEHFILDQHPDWKNLWFCAGLSGHGFKFTCVLGKALADLSTTGRTDLPVDFLRLDRFH